MFTGGSFLTTNTSVLVTGGDGNIGREVISQLLSKKDDNLKIVGGVRSLDKKKDTGNRVYQP